MPRIRCIKPEFWSDDKVMELSIQARLLFIGLWNFADDNGVVENKPRQIKARIFPGDDIDVVPLIEELARVGVIYLYEVDGVPYLIIKNLTKHQVIDRRRKSSLPMPQNDLFWRYSDDFNGNQLISTEISIGREGKGKEGKGKEGNVLEEALGKTNHKLEMKRVRIARTENASPMPDGMDGDAAPCSEQFLDDDFPDTVLPLPPDKPARRRRKQTSTQPESEPPNGKTVYDCEVFTVDEKFHDELCQAFPLLPPAQILAEYERIRDWCLDNRLVPRHRPKFFGNGRLRHPRRFLKNWLRKTEPSLKYAIPSLRVREPPPEPEEILVPDPSCPFCHGRGLAVNGPCGCLHPEGRPKHGGNEETGESGKARDELSG